MRHQFPSVAFGLLLFAIGFGAHYVALSWIRRVWPRVARAGRLGLVPCVAFAVLPSVARHLTLRTQLAWIDAVLSASLVEVVFVVAAALPLLVVLAVSSPKAATTTDAAPNAVAEDSALGRRRALETLGGGAVLGGVGLAVGWGATRGRHDYQIDEIAIRIPGLPRALDGYVIAQISDVHAGLFVGERELREGGDRVRSLKADMLVVTGDLVDFDARHAPPLARALADLAPRDGVHAILGNHDYYAGADTVTDAIRAAGVNLLVNGGRVVRPGDGGGFALLGVDDQWSRRYGGAGPRLSQAVAGISPDMPRVLLSHQPETFDTFAGQVTLQLSGHTHGGQIAPAGVLLRYRAGLYQRAGSALYVNRGFGVAGPPVRLGVPPEITKIVLVAA